MSALETPRKVWTRQDVARIDPILAENLELVAGDLLDKMGKRPPHIFWSEAIRDWFIETFGGEFVRSENPIDVRAEDNPTSEPEPDLVLTLTSRKQTRGANPAPADIRLAVEISDRTYQFDIGEKAALYARAGIPEYWVVDVRVPDAPVVILHRHSDGKTYTSVSRFPHTADTPVVEERTLRLQSLL